MSISLLKIRNKTAMLLAVLMVLSLVSIPTALAADPVTVAAWNYSAAPGVSDVPATSGVLSTGAILSNFKAASPTYSTTSLSINGWDNGADTKYWQLSLSTTGYENLTLTAQTRSSGTGPRDFKVTYSLDSGTTWTDVTGGSYAVTGTALSNYMTTLTLPAEAANAGSLLIRFIMTSNISSRAGTGTYAADEAVASGGTSNINNIVITGTEMQSTTRVGDVAAVPAGGAAAEGSKVALSCETDGSSIMYSLNGADYQAYDQEAQVTLATLPVTLYAYGVKDGMENGDTASWDFTKAQVAAITANPAGGDVAEGSKVTLSCGTDGAAIMYSINGGELQTYDPALQVTLDTLPATLSAHGVKDGMTDGEASSWEFTKVLKTAAVTANPGSGALSPGSQVTLSCDTPGAQIKYSLDSGATWNDYSSAIMITALPASIQAYAISEGLLDSDTVTFEYSDYNIYFGQLHSHTTNSDGIGTLDEAYSHAKNDAGVDFLAIADHSNSLESTVTANMGDGSSSTKWINGHNAADSYTDANFVGIYAFEMTWSNGTGHMNTFNTAGFENRANSVYTASDGLQKYYNVLKNYPDSVSQFNHPGTTFGDFNDFANYDPTIDQRISLVEVGNGEGAVGSNLYFPSYEYYTRALDKGWHLAPTNNQDNHLGNWGDSNTARTVVLAESLTRDNIYDALRNMRVYATEDNNLRIKYTLNGEIMGTILSEKPGSVNISVELQDPDGEALGKVSVISNGGRVVASRNITNSDDTVTFDLSPDYSYYYIKVEEDDGDIAVTAPVWIDEVDKAGISKTTGSSGLPLKGEPLTITTSLFNNEDSAMNVTSLEYSIGGSVIHTATAISPVASSGTGSYSFSYTPETAGKFDLNVRLIATINGVEKTFTGVLKVNVADPAVTTKIVVDASHYNDYVSGYYSGNMTNLVAIANQEGMSVVIQTAPLTDASLSGVQLLILSAPAKKNGTAGGVAYTASPYTDDELAVIERYAANGGNIIVTALADYQDNKTAGDTTNESAYQQNRVLAAIGADISINDDEVIDYDNNPNVPTPGQPGGTPYRIPMGTYNTDSPYLNGVDPAQRYSFYSGCSFTMGPDSIWLVKGWPSTYGFDADNDGLGGSYVSNAATTMPADTGIGKGNMVALATEPLSGGGRLFVGGTVFYSNFEVKATLDNYGQLQNSNYNILMNILDSIRKVVPVSQISEARAGTIGSAYCVEGTVTAGKTPSDNAFFDTIYIQDATGGINIFPVAGSDIQVGQKVKVTGTLDQYQGDLELRVVEMSVTDTAVNPIEPALLSTHDAMEAANGGKLVKVEGIVTRMDTQNIYIDDGSGEARVFVDGYIGDGSGDASKLGKWDENIEVGSRVSAIGLASVDTYGARLRVRNTSEIVKADIHSHTVTFISDGSTYSTDTVNYGDHVTKPVPDPAKTGYAFGGWYNGETEWNFDSDTMPDNDLTLTAKWETLSTYLKGISLTPGAALSPSTFSKTRYYYRVRLTEDTESVTITPVLENSSSTVTMTMGKTTISPAAPINLKKGQTATVRIKVSLTGKSSHTYTLTVMRAKSTDNTLSNLSYSAGALDPSPFAPGTTSYTLRLDEYTESVTITPAMDDEYQKIYMDGRYIDGVRRTGRTYSLDNGHYKYSRIKVVAQNGVSKTYTVKITRDKSTDAYLKSLKTSPGKYALDKPFEKNTEVYTVQLPDNASGVTLMASKDNKDASVTFIDGAKQYRASSRYFQVANGTQKDIIIRVTAQANTAEAPEFKEYTVRILRAPRITAFSASPCYGYYPSISPGGDNRLTFKWTQKGRGNVTVDVLYLSGIASTWQNICPATEFAAGAQKLAWNAQSETPLPAGKYKARIKVTNEFGTSSYDYLIFVVLKTVTPTISASKSSITQGGTQYTKITVKWNVFTNIKVEVYDSADTLVATLLSAAYRYPDTRTMKWYGKYDAAHGGTAVPAGTYTIRVTAGGVTPETTVTVTTA